MISTPCFRSSLIFLLGAMPCVLFAQPPQYVQLMADPNAYFQDTQQAFEAYWQGRSVTPSSGYKPFKRWEYWMSQRLAPDGKQNRVLLTDSIYKAYRSAQPTRSNVSRTVLGDWKLLGPSVVPARAYGDPSSGDGIGRVSAIAFHPVDSNIVYVGSPSGGFWRSFDRGNSWEVVEVGASRLGISSIIVHPNAPDTIYIGTGDIDHSDAPGLGVWRSVDGGDTWHSWSNGMTFPNNSILVMDPNDPDNLIASSLQHLYRSTDGGANWTDELNTSPYLYIKSLVHHPSTSGIIYAAGSGPEVYRTIDQGVTWTLAGAGLPTIDVSRIALATTPDAPNNVYALVALNDENYGFGGLFRSVDQGLTFTQMSNAPNIIGYGNTGGTGNQAWYDLFLSVDPNDKQRVVCGAINIWTSNDEGVTMEFSSYRDGVYYPVIHVDQHVAAWSPHDNSLWVGNDGGIYSSDDRGQTWTDRTEGMSISQVYRCDVSTQVPERVINGYQDNGTSALINGVWHKETGGDGMHCIIDPTNDSVMYSSYQLGQGLNRSIDNGHTWYNLKNGISQEGAWISPFALHPNNPNILYWGLKDVWRTNNAQAEPSSNVSWTNITNSGANHNYFQLEVSGGTPNIAYAYQFSAGLLRTFDIDAATLVWDTLNSVSGSVKRIAIDPHDPGIVFISTFWDILRSDDAGDTWTNITGSLPSIAINSICVDPRSDVDAIYVGLDVGVYYRDNTMSDWELFNAGLPMMEVTDLHIYHDTICPSNSTITAGTYGRGTWVSPLRDTPFSAPMSCLNIADESTCVGIGVELSATSSNSPTDWNWSILPSTVSYLNGTSEMSEAPVVVFTAPGTYSVSLITSNGFGSDTTDVASITVLDTTTSSPPLLVANGDTVLCIGDSLNLSTNTSAEVYRWYLNGSIVSEGGNDSLWVKEEGSYTLTTSNGCNSSVVSNVMVISANQAPVQPVQIVGPISVCDGDTAVYGIGTVASSTGYNWSYPSGWNGFLSDTIASFGVTEFSTGSLDLSYDPGGGANNQVNTVSSMVDGRSLIGGTFTTFNGISQGRLTRLLPDASVDMTFNSAGADGNIFGSAVKPDGSAIIVGSFFQYDGVNSSRVAYLNPDGSLDGSFSVGSGLNSAARTALFQTDGKVIIGGHFTSFNGTVAGRIVRLLPNGSIDPDFDTGSGADDVVVSMGLQTDGKILIGGSFTSINGIARNGIARLNADGSVDPSFDPNGGVNGIVHKIEIQQDGKILIGGTFTTYDGATRGRVARLHGNGSLDNSYSSAVGANAPIYSIILKSNGKAFVCGAFTSVDGVPRNGIALLDTTGGVDQSFDPGSGPDQSVISMALQPNGELLIGGWFNNYNGTTRNKVARVIANDDLIGVQATNECGASTVQTLTVDVEAVPATPIPGAYGPFCSSDGPVTLAGNPPGGVWNGVGIIGNQFDPSVGTQTLTYVVSNGTCSSNAQTTIVVGSCDCNGVPNGNALPGTPCNDNDSCTVSDLFNTSCLCVGTFQDSDSDGICDTQDSCPNIPGQQGDACNDGNACTNGETLLADCSCGGGSLVDPDDNDPCTLDSCDPVTGISNVFQDADGDGVCDANDQCPGIDDNLIGTACNDTDACTTGETYQMDCSCGGGVTVDPDDGDPCTLDSCDPVTGVSNSPIAIPTAAEVHGPSSIALNNSYTFHVDPVSGADSYVWTFNGVDSTNTPGVTVDHTIDSLPTEVCVQVVVNDCVGDSVCALFDISTSTFVAFNNDIWLNIQPNPSTGGFDIVPSGTNTEPIEVRLFDSVGQLVRPEFMVYGTSPVYVDLSNEADGVYFLKASREGDTQVLALVIQR